MTDPRDIERINPDDDSAVNTNTNTPPEGEHEQEATDVPGAVIHPGEAPARKPGKGGEHAA